jgi:hypothetical protein
MFHILAITTLAMFLIFAVATFITQRTGLTRAQLVDWDDRPNAPKTQLIHSYFAMVLLVLLLITFLFAPVGWLIWLTMLANYGMNHLVLRPKIQIPPMWSAALGWTSFVAETLYLFYLAFGT